MNFRVKLTVVRVAKEILSACIGKSLSKGELLRLVTERISFALPPAGLYTALVDSTLFDVTVDTVTLRETEATCPDGLPENASNGDTTIPLHDDGSAPSFPPRGSQTLETKKTHSSSIEAIIRLAQEVLSTESGKRLRKDELERHVAGRLGVNTRRVAYSLLSSMVFRVTNDKISLRCDGASTVPMTNYQHVVEAETENVHRATTSTIESATTSREQERTTRIIRTPVAESTSPTNNRAQDTLSKFSAAERTRPETRASEIVTAAQHDNTTLSLTPPDLAAEAKCMSDFAQLIAQCTEFYTAQASDLPIHKWNGGIVPAGSVGIQCKFCSVSQKTTRQRVRDGELVFPARSQTLAIIFYQFVDRHLIAKCASIPSATKSRLRSTKITTTSQSMRHGRIGFPTYIRFILAHYQLADGLPYGLFHRDTAAVKDMLALPVVTPVKPQPPEPKQSRRIAARTTRKAPTRSPSPLPVAKRRRKNAVAKSKPVINTTLRKNVVGNNPAAVSNITSTKSPSQNSGANRRRAVVVKVTPRKRERTKIPHTKSVKEPSQGSLQHETQPGTGDTTSTEMEETDSSFLMQPLAMTFLTLEHPGFFTESTVTDIAYEDL